MPVYGDGAGMEERACRVSRAVCEVRGDRSTVTCPHVGNYSLFLPEHTGTRSRQCRETGLSSVRSCCCHSVIRG